MTTDTVTEAMVEAARVRPTDDPVEVERLRARCGRLLIAFHDATRRPLGVTPANGDEFYNWRLAGKAEEARPRIGSEAERSERPEVQLVATQARADALAHEIRTLKTAIRAADATTRAYNGDAVLLIDGDKMEVLRRMAGLRSGGEDV